MLAFIIIAIILLSIAIIQRQFENNNKLPPGQSTTHYTTNRYVAKNTCPQSCKDTTHPHNKTLVYYHIYHNTLVRNRPLKSCIDIVEGIGDTVEEADKNAKISLYESLSKILLAKTKELMEIEQVMKQNK